MALVSVPAIGSAANKPVKLLVKLSNQRELYSQGSVMSGMRKLFQQREFCDVVLVCEEQEFHAHKCVLASKSEAFKSLLADSSEVRFAEIANPEALRWMLDYFYEAGSYGVGEQGSSAADYSPGSQAVNADVLRLAQKYDLPALRARATTFMTKELTTHNAVDRLATCDEFGLTELREKILGQLTANKRALAEVTSSPAITCYPSLMREMLALIANEGLDTAGAPAKKKAKRAA